MLIKNPLPFYRSIFHNYLYFARTPHSVKENIEPKNDTEHSVDFPPPGRK